MSESELRDKIKQIFIEQFGPDDFEWEKTQEQYERWDSLAHMDLVGKMEKAFNVQFELDEVLSFVKPQSFFDQLKKKIST